MPYGVIKVDQVTFTNAGVDQTISVSGIVASISGNITATGTISGDVIRGGTTVSGATVTGTAGRFGTVTGNTAGFTTVTGTTVTGATASFTSGVFTSISGGTHTITSGVFASGTAAAPSITFAGDLDTGVYASATNQVSITTSGTERLRIDATGQIEAASLGTAAAPAYSFTANPDTGVYSPGTNQLAISTAGTGRLFVDANGNVGVGTGGTQSSKFHVEGTSRFVGAPSAIFNGTTGTYSTWLYNETSVGDIGTSNQVFSGGANTDFAITSRGATALVFGTNATERMRIDSSGRLGIGTSSPSTVLHIAGNADQRFTNTTNTAGFDIGLLNGTGSADAYVYNRANAAVIFGANNAERARIDSSGRLGIGTSSPTGALDVAVGGAGPARVILSQAADNPYIDFYRSDGVSAFTGARISNPTANIGALAFLTASTNTAIGSHTFTERVRIDSSGRLLVGTSSTSSTALFQVQGNSSSSTGGAILQLRRGTNNAGIVNNTALGSIEFSNTESTVSAVIAAEADANWNTTNDYPSRLTFSTTADGASSPTERMRISSTGLVSITSSTTSTGGLLGVDNTNNASGSGVMSLANRANNNNTSSYYLVCQEPGVANRCFIYGNGNVANLNNSYGAISDIKLKENVVPAASQWSDIKALQVRKYNFKEETGSQTHTQIGLVAQEVELVSPGLVSESPDRDEEGNDLGTVTKSVNYSVLYMKAVKALQEAMERIEQLETSNTDLLARVTALESA